MKAIVKMVKGKLVGKTQLDARVFDLLLPYSFQLKASEAVVGDTAQPNASLQKNRPRNIHLGRRDRAQLVILASTPRGSNLVYG